MYIYKFHFRILFMGQCAAIYIYIYIYIYICIRPFTFFSYFFVYILDKGIPTITTHDGRTIRYCGNSCPNPLPSCASFFFIHFFYMYNLDILLRSLIKMVFYLQTRLSRPTTLLNQTSPLGNHHLFLNSTLVAR